MKTLIKHTLSMKPCLFWLAFVFWLLSFSSFGQSSNQNYVKSITYKRPSTQGGIDPNNPAHVMTEVTYIDGLGRPIQQVAHKQSGDGKDIITHIEYDQFGRQPKEYLPFEVNATAMLFDSDALAHTLSFYNTIYYENTVNPYSEKLFEPSPLNRVLKQGAPGSDWQIGGSNDHTIKSGYLTNKANEVKLFKAATGTTTSNGMYVTSLTNSSGTTYYGAGQLYKTVVTDENGSKTEEFKDKEGRVILKRAYNGAVKHDTYYVYDIYGNLSYVIPPKAVDKGSITLAVLADLCYQYRYDARNRLVEKKLPGKAVEHIVYDKLDRVVATGPALSPFEGSSATGWLITKYDVLGRVAYTGWSNVNAGTTPFNRNSVQNSVNSMANLFVTRQNSTVDNVSIGYSNNSTYPSTLKLLTVNYYDSYTYPNAPSSVPSTVEGENVTPLRKGLATGSWVRVLTTASETYNELSYTLYDHRARPLRAYTKNHLGGYTRTDTKLDFIGSPQYTITTHKRVDMQIKITV